MRAERAEGPIRVLVVGSGGREHALMCALARSPRPVSLHCAPGNPGMAAIGSAHDVAAGDLAGIVALVEREQIDLTVVGPEAPLVAGLVDELTAAGRRAFGPSAAAARLEGSKIFAKEAMERAGVPTAAWRKASSLQQGLAALEELWPERGQGEGVVVKADGLAAGKGVTVAGRRAEAEAALEEIFLRERFGPAPSAVIEELLRGDELSLLAICDGERALPLAPARDYKRIFDADRGPNTGGMGSFSPVAGIGEAEVERLSAQVHAPIVKLMAQCGTPFHGVLYAGLMIGADGARVLEYNVRFGDPETQSVLPRLQSDLVELLARATSPGGLAAMGLRWSEQTAVTVILAAAGYPGAVRSGDAISGLERVAAGIEVTHAGTAESDGKLVTAGGRVLGVTALASELREARSAAYAAAQMVEFDGRQMRTDIAAGA